MIFNEGSEQFNGVGILYLVGNNNRCFLKLKF